MATISLEGAIRTCKVDTAWAPRMMGERIFNPGNMVCPTWNHRDSSGRPVCANSYNTKTAGCHSASDRVMIENDLRPQYIDYVTLDASGIRGDQHCPQSASYACGKNTLNSIPQQTGQFGNVTGFGQYISPNCQSCKTAPEYVAPAASAQRARARAYKQSAAKSYQNMKMAGNRREGYRKR